MKSKNCVLLLLLISMFSTIAFAQEKKTVSGKVVDDAGKGIPGVTVSVKGSKTTVVSNAEGEFSISASPSDVLVLSSVGYEKTEMPVGNNSFLNLSLKAAVGSLDE